MGIARGVIGGYTRAFFGRVHEIARPSENVLYIADENKWRLQKLLLHRSGHTTALNR